MMRKRRTLLLSSLLSGMNVLLACGERPSTARGLIWSVTRNGATIHFVPTIHKSPAKLGVPAALTKTLESAHVLAVELDVLDQETAAISAQCDRVAALKLPYVELEPGIQDELDGMLSKVNGGVSLKAQHPFVQASYVSSHVIQSWPLAHGLDYQLVVQAKKRDTPVVALESACEWFNTMVEVASRLSAPEAKLLVREAVTEASSANSTWLVLTLIRAWETGDSASFERTIHDWQRRSPALSRFLLAQYASRNATMQRRILALHRTNLPLVVAVGALHMWGPNGLPELFRRDGWSSAIG